MRTVLAALLLFSVSARAGELAKEVGGHGSPILLVHCLGCDRTEWRDVAAQLRRTHRVIAVDLPGMGATPPRARYDLDETADELSALLHAERATPAVVIGHSLGGAIAAHLAERHPADVAGLVVVDMLIKDAFDDAEIDKLRKGLAQDRKKSLDAWYAAMMKPGDLERIRPSLDKVSSATLLGWAEALMRQPILDGGAKLTMPTLLLATASLLPDKKPRDQALAAIGFGAAPHLTVERFPEAAHWIMWNAPRRFDEVLERWLARLPR